MGAGASAAGAAGPGSPKGKNSKDATTPEYIVTPADKDKSALPSRFYMRLEPESVVFADLETREQMRHYPYYTIMCWGHTSNTFQFRLYQPGTKVEAVSVGTRRGVEIEVVILDVVKKLMKKMKKDGTSKEEFEQMMGVVKSEEDGETCVDLVKKFFSSHNVTINQALDLLEIMNFPTSFDKIAVAAASYEALMNKEAFSMILHLFEDYHDRLNLCHMLKLPDDMAVGETVKPTPEKKSAAKKEPGEEELMAPFKEKD
jgi:hypothetical protein|eukprot:g7103.t1